MSRKYAQNGLEGLFKYSSYLLLETEVFKFRLQLALNKRQLQKKLFKRQ